MTGIMYRGSFGGSALRIAIGSHVHSAVCQVARRVPMMASPITGHVAQSETDVTYHHAAGGGPADDARLTIV
jgi:hypothetical protein